MPPLSHRFTALLATLAVFGAHAACVCHSVAAAATVTHSRAQPSGDKASHSCCKHTEDNKTDSRPQPAKSPGGCRHCAGLVTATSTPTSDGFAVNSNLQAPAFALPVIAPCGLPSQTAHADLAVALVLPHPTTLLRLHCALNL
jgi:hypothetical protein